MGRRAKGATGATDAIERYGQGAGHDAMSPLRPLRPIRPFAPFASLYFTAMSQSRFAILDPAAGISGDMLLGALVAAGASEDWLRGVPARLGFADVSIAIGRVDRCGLQAVKVDVLLPGGEKEEPGDAHFDGEAHALEHRRHGAHGHRHLPELLDIVTRAPLTPWVRTRALAAFQALGEAEGRVHGVPPENVSLHEVGAIDAVVDIVATIEGFEQLGIETVYHWPLSLGSGWVRSAHGVLPVPAPATALLVEGMEIRQAGPVTGEATTPTGAALLRVLSKGAPPARWRAVATAAWGAGTRNPGDYPNALRLVIAEPVQEAGEAVVLATDVDDLTPEYLEPLREALLGAGALDVQVWATQAKKGRTGFRVEVTVSPAEADRVADALFRHSTTAGVRSWRAERTTLPRREILLDVGGGKSVRVKVLDGPDGPRVKPEFEDVARLALERGQPAHEVARELQTTALGLLRTNGGVATEPGTRSPTT